ncbi:hypothetical protein SERLA73DRAFT_72853 [Serpula lacrymans var. lacrymans S7.3]|uniref:Uncharacterized protein n=2 Tax=Serpula lacrymans var. lacrymans TaxID=341189 RepID=F8PV33_SERL3|nr:uncharacterized protein SERLADRAFT_437400 [Serpula lacrymans var. lacrymans S7.9]EGO00113.1 hypothetical protein SERLA73DRAFT_72853 [Serpula lacrymans var. lacrymans S7.3]EGO25675.1 hypothetical protein SERLADRAFT_437400 [Serpula lacrymans var. lacrymans S7.9]
MRNWQEVAPSSAARDSSPTLIVGSSYPNMCYTLKKRPFLHPVAGSGANMMNPFKGTPRNVSVRLNTSNPSRFRYEGYHGSEFLGLTALIQEH